jgi:endoglucanase
VAQERGTPLPTIQLEGGRGRVAVVDGRLVTDLGTPLRGLTLPVDFDWQLDDFQLMTTIAETTGLNTVHVFLENADTETGSKLTNADALVSLTAQAGLYLVLGIGGGKENGSFTPEKVTAFWNLYAPRYAKSTHVLFEIQNNPEVTCEKSLLAKTITMEREAYQLIRGYAPDTHVVLFSTTSVPRQTVVEQAIDAVNDVVDFSNASFAMHTDATCTPVAELGGIFDAARAKQVPVLISALPSEGWPAVVTACEGQGVSWLHHRWLAYEPSLDALFTEMAQAKLTWCPDLGTYPGPAGGCRKP